MASSCGFHSCCTRLVEDAFGFGIDVDFTASVDAERGGIEDDDFVAAVDDGDLGRTFEVSAEEDEYFLGNSSQDPCLGCVLDAIGFGVKELFAQCERNAWTEKGRESWQVCSAVLLNPKDCPVRRAVCCSVLSMVHPIS